METLKDYNRLAINFRKSYVQEVLPEYFQESYPAIISFLEGYYEYLDSDEQWGGGLNELITIRDFEDTTLQRLNFVLSEIGLGVSSGRFIFPREVLRNFGNFFRVKGSEYSAYGFFRAFFNDNDIELIYPKESLFRVGQSLIGPDDGYTIQDGGIHQIFSIIVKSGKPISEWEALWRKYVHPSGFHLGAEVLIIGKDQLTFGTADEFALIYDPYKVHSSVQYNYVAEGEITGLYQDNELYAPEPVKAQTAIWSYMKPGYIQWGYVLAEDDEDKARERLDVYKTPIAYGINATINQVTANYNTIDEWAGFHLKTGSSTVNFSNTSSFSTFDQVYHVQYTDSDGEVQQYNYYK
jgi:hypothetical protein